MDVPPSIERCARYENVCQDILYEIRNNEPLEKIRIERKKLQGRCITDAIFATDDANIITNKYLKPSPSFDEKCNCYDAQPQLIHAINKLTAEITYQADKETLTKYIRNGIFNFGIDLFYGSVQQNIDVVIRLHEAALKESQEIGFSIPLSIYLLINPRKQFTGGLKGNKKSFYLKPKAHVTITTDRKYASRCHRGVIYVNARFLMFDMQKCDIIRLGDIIELQVQEVGEDRLSCIVLVPGDVTKRMPVRFPAKFDWAHLSISAEELEDITFAKGTEINVIVTNSPGIPETCEQIRTALAQFNCCHYYLFTRITLDQFDQYVNVKWMINHFDGFLFDCSMNTPQDRIVQLPIVVHRFIKKAFFHKKPFFLAGCWSLFVHPKDYEIAFYYPDKYILPCKPDFLHLYEAFSHNFSLAKCMEKNFHDRSLTGTYTIARSIAAASFEFDADVIVTCAVSGQMAEKIAHYRPEAPIIVVTNVASAINYGGMHHNIWMLLFDVNKTADVAHRKDVHQKLVYGVQYAIKKKLILHTSKIILVYRTVPRYGFPDKFVIIKFTDDYAEVIKRAILAK